MNPSTLVIPLIAPESVATQPDSRNSTSLAVGESTPIEQPVWGFGSHCLELDGVRGIAILLVTLYRFIKEWDPSAHWLLGLGKKYCDLGERGVDLFFVLSGFLITGILLQTKTSEGYFKNFIIRRALRIFPLYFTSLVVCLFVLPLLMGTQVFDLPRSNQFFLWTYTSNVYMAWTNTWCFGPLDHFWSLAVEEHFYLVWPAIVYCLSSKALLRLAIGMIVGVGAARMFFTLRPECGVAVDALTLFRCDALAMGAMLAVLLKHGLSADQVNRVAKWVLPLLVVAGFAVVFSGKRLLGIPHSLWGCIWVAAMAVVVTRPRSHRLSHCLRASWLQWLGRYSYGMYVVQLPLVTMLPLSFAAEHWNRIGLSPVLFGIAYVSALFAMTCVIAMASFHLLEKPFLKMKRWFA
ncbi:MAG: acyltransferase family protein [Planctomycetota bacterium]|jgi:peptidoglycan/LPS O-acetylase OafA/YrhL